jgi:hypothetical protein
VKVFDPMMKVLDLVVFVCSWQWHAIDVSLFNWFMPIAIEISVCRLCPSGYVCWHACFAAVRTVLACTTEMVIIDVGPLGDIHMHAVVTSIFVV